MFEQVLWRSRRRRLTIATLPSQEIDSSNPKVKKEATALMVTLYRQIGPKLKALSMSLSKKQEMKSYLDKCFSESNYDPSSLPSTWPKQSIVRSSDTGVGAAGPGTGPDSLELDIPKTDLFSLLPPDIAAQMVSMGSGREAK